MVDALRRATRWLAPGGCVVDIHPDATPPAIEIDGRPAGRVDTADGPARHAAADAAVRTALANGWVVAERSGEFDFYTYADSVDELRDHIEENWRDARIVLDTAAAGRPRAREHVRIAKLVVPTGRV